MLQFLLTKISFKVGQSYQSYVSGFPQGGKFWRELVAGAKRGGGGGGGGGEKREGENPTPLSFPHNLLPLSKAATQATLIAIKTTQLPTDYTGGYMIFEGKNYFHFWLSC